MESLWFPTPNGMSPWIPGEHKILQEGIRGGFRREPAGVVGRTQEIPWYSLRFPRGVSLALSGHQGNIRTSLGLPREDSRFPPGYHGNTRDVPRERKEFSHEIPREVSWVRTTSRGSYVLLGGSHGVQLNVAGSRLIHLHCPWDPMGIQETLPGENPRDLVVSRWTRRDPI